jgi:hypothetical protein
MTERDMPVFDWWEWIFLAIIVCEICIMMWVVFST